MKEIQKNKLGTIAIVGRPNVGKSSLFNRMIKMRKSIVDSIPGVTRDRIYGLVSWLDYEFSVIDTGGFQLSNAPFQEAINTQVEIALTEADIIVFVVDYPQGVHPDDLLIARKLHKATQTVVLVANKYDRLNDIQNEYDFYQLGFEKPHLISAAHGIGVGDLLETIVKELPRLAKSNSNCLKIGLIGCPNVGKSTLLNSFLGEERSIVSPVSGTTRDPVDSNFTRFQKNYLVYDTAGIRRKSRINTDVEYYAVLKAIRTLENVDLVLLLLDSTQDVSEQEKTLGALIVKYHKPVIMVSNKWDAVKSKTEKTMEIFKKTIYSYFPHLKYAPLVFISALKNRRLHLLFKAIDVVQDNLKKRIPTALLNRVVQETLVLNSPPLIAGKQLKIFYVTQLIDSIGTFVLFVNDKKHAYIPYLRYIENEIRNQFGFSGIPIKLILNNRREN